MSDQGFSINLRLVEGYLFQIDFGDFGNFMVDEPEPLGKGEGPNAERMLAAAVANCLCASLLFAVRKFKGEPGELSATISGSTERVDKRLRIAGMEVTITLGNTAAELPHLDRALDQFEDFCVVTQSVRRGIPVKVSVIDGEGTVVKEH
ncbi:OsmC family protein [Gilvimarinus sp. F26214L]|uniref:OsmC family protein n=1 Tax=Gilvimarinus sp. DZF01 TaxID=3461371 RepID=UPI004045E723